MISFNPPNTNVVAWDAPGETGESGGPRGAVPFAALPSKSHEATLFRRRSGGGGDGATGLCWDNSTVIEDGDPTSKDAIVNSDNSHRSDHQGYARMPLDSRMATE